MRRLDLSRYTDIYPVAIFKEKLKEEEIVDCEGTAFYSDGNKVFQQVESIENLDQQFSHIAWLIK